MFRRICGVLAVSLLALVLVGAGASAGANRHTITLTMSTEAWYQEPPPCVSLIDCSAAPAAGPYPQDTVHVSVTGGQETARTYLAFRFLVPFGASLLGGTLSLPVDQDPGAGTLQPDQADMQACLVTGSFKAVRGSLATPPKADCRRTWGAQYDSKTATFTVDLTPFLPAWRSGIFLSLRDGTCRHQSHCSAGTQSRNAPANDRLLRAALHRLPSCPHR